MRGTLKEREEEREREGGIEGQTCVQQIRERQRFGGSQFAVAVVLVVAGGAAAAAAVRAGRAFNNARN